MEEEFSLDTFSVLCWSSRRFRSGKGVKDNLSLVADNIIQGDISHVYYTCSTLPSSFNAIHIEYISAIELQAESGQLVDHLHNLTFYQ